jgi:mRNA-degrading endonuclease RelE of RelBE toxin-antitoxin system
VSCNIKTEFKKKCQKGVKKLSKSCQKVLKKLSNKCQKSCQKSCQKFIKKLEQLSTANSVRTNINNDIRPVKCSKIAENPKTDCKCSKIKTFRTHWRTFCFPRPDATKLHLVITSMFLFKSTCSNQKLVRIKKI